MTASPTSTVEIPVIAPHPTIAMQFKVRKGLRFQFSGRMDEPEVIFNESRTRSGVTIGLGELCQLAAFVGLTGYEPYINPGTVRQLKPLKVGRHYADYTRFRLVPAHEPYAVESQRQFYAHDDHPGYTRVDIENFDAQQRPYEITIKNKWGHNPADKVVIWPEDVKAVLDFIIARPFESEYIPRTESEHLPILGVPIFPEGRDGYNSWSAWAEARRATKEVPI
jgi:hypothetical protein